MEHFKDMHHIREDGRYVMKLPRVADPPEMGNSKEMAENIFHQNERCLLQKGLFESFTGVVNEYVELGHVEQLPKEESKGSSLLHANSKCVEKVIYHHQDESCFGSLYQDFNRSYTLLAGPALHPMVTDVLQSQCHLHCGHW